MKRLMSVSLTLLSLSFLIPLLLTSPAGIPAPSPVISTAQVSITVSASSAVSASPPASGDAAMIKLSLAGGVQNISMRDYLIGVVAAEMPASFGIEALKAQTVASRSYAIYAMREKRHDGADLCGSSSCCSAYADQNALREKWGLNFDVYYEKIKSAVEATDGEYLSYEGEPILAVFHSSSYGSTESSENVWASPKPYLKSVSTPESVERVTNLFTTVPVTLQNFKETILKKHKEAAFGADPAQWISSILYDESGRVSYLYAGGVKIAGTEFRQLFNLRSAAFSFKLENSAFVFSVSGYGHGVGMSQYGANILASSGMKYVDILKTYYTGTQISRLSGANP